MIKTNYLLNFITVLVFLYSCNSQNNSHNSEDIQSKAEIQEADISSVYMGFDMNKSFNETMESLKRIQKKDSTFTFNLASSYVDENIVEKLNIQKADTVIEFKGKIAVQKSDSTYEEFETKCKAHFIDSLFYMLEVSTYLAFMVDEEDVENSELIQGLYEKKYGSYSVNTTKWDSHFDDVSIRPLYSSDESIISERIKTCYEILGWNFSSIDIYIAKHWDEEKRWYANTDNVRHAERELYYRSNLDHSDLNRLLNKVYVKRTEIAQQQLRVNIYYLNKKIQNHFDEIKRQEELKIQRQNQLRQDSIENAKKRENELYKNAFNSQSI